MKKNEISKLLDSRLQQSIESETNNVTSEESERTCEVLLAK